MAGTNCPQCGSLVPPGAAFCGSCGTPIGPPVPPPTTTPAGRRPRRLSSLQIAIILVVVVVVVVSAVGVVVAAEVFGTVHHHWSTRLALEPGVPSSTVASFPLTVTLQGGWSAVGSGWVNLSISTFGGTVYDGNGTLGSFGFGGSLFPYEFSAESDAYENVTVWANYTTHGSGL